MKTTSTKSQNNHLCNYRNVTKLSAIILSILIVLCLLLAGCSKQESTSSASNTADSKYQNSLNLIKTRTLLNLHNADPDQLEDYQTVIHSNIFDVMDIDLRKTSDGKWINIHDDNFKGVKIADNTYEKICATDPTNFPISFDEFLDFAKQYNVILQIEDKTSLTGNFAEIAEIVKKHDAMDLVYYSKNSYDVINQSLDYFNSAMIFDVWMENCTKEQAIQLRDKAEKKGGKIMLNTSINKNEYLSPEEVKEWAEKGFLIEVGFNYTDGSKQAFVDFFKKYDIQYINTLKIDAPTYNNYVSAFRACYGFEAL